MKSIFLFITLIVIFTACSVPKDASGVWINKEKMQGKSFNSVFILAITADLESRTIVENDLAAAVVAKGYKAVKSIDVLAPTLGNSKIPSKEEVLSKVKASGCDAVFTASVMKKDDGVNYTPGTEAYNTTPMYVGYGYYYGYYSNANQTVSTSGYYTQAKSYVIQSNLYDAASEQIMWSVKTDVADPVNIGNFSKKYAAALIKQLEYEGLYKKKAN